jgi:1-acyl-sn-glycerol-3-phosphate acyltransferase
MYNINVDSPAALPTPWRLLPPLALGILSGRRVDFGSASRQAVSHLPKPPLITGKEYIPRTGPGLIAINHYTRPGFPSWWMGFLLCASVPRPVNWITGEAWTAAGHWHEPLKVAVTRWAFTRMARVYGFFPMPPMPPRPEDTERRARTVRQVLEYARSHPQAFIAVAPEGRDEIDQQLQPPHPGTGRFLYHLARLGYPVSPVGLWEEGDQIRLAFGPSFHIPGDIPKKEIDRAAADQVMLAIASLLPEERRGAYHTRSHS